MNIFNLFRSKSALVKSPHTDEEYYAEVEREREIAYADHMRTQGISRCTPKLSYDDVEAALKELAGKTPANDDERYAAADAFVRRFAEAGDRVENHLGHILYFLPGDGNGWVVSLRNGYPKLDFFPLWMKEYEAAIANLHDAAASGDAFKVNAAYGLATKIKERLEHANGHHVSLEDICGMLSPIYWPGYPMGYW